jgi:hypothetical protein
MSSAKFVKGARPIKDQKVKDFYNLDVPSVTLDEYTSAWREWLSSSNANYLGGLDSFKFAHYTQGTSQAFDNFVIRHSRDRYITTIQGDFQYHKCLSKFLYHRELDFLKPRLKKNSALLISLPFSDLGMEHPEFNSLLGYCNRKKIPVCLDLAYWGITKGIHLSLDKFPCIEEVTVSLSKPFYTLENHRVGVRFTREYQDDGISMINEVNYQNHLSMALGVAYMQEFPRDYLWSKYMANYHKVSKQFDMEPTDTVIFCLGDERYKEFNRGTRGVNRVCISNLLGDVLED